MAELKLENLTKSFGDHTVIHDLDLIVPDGSFTVFVGPSGCGKSTLLRMISGLEEISGGQISLNGNRCDHLLPSKRNMAMVFQSYALYPHMSVYKNLEFGMVSQKMEKAAIAPKIHEAARLLQIEELLDRRPHQLSGGQSQRVAIGRAIVLEPDIFLLDEPLSNLDAELRVKMRVELTDLHKRLGNTMIYVTHDQVEAMTMADQIVVLRAGRIEQFGPPLELYTRPANLFVAGFLGTPQMNFVEGRLVGEGKGATVEISGSKESLPVALAEGASSSKDVTVGFRPEHIQLDSNGPMKATVKSLEHLGSETMIYAQMGETKEIVVRAQGIQQLASGDVMSLSVAPQQTYVFDAKSEKCISVNFE